MTKMCKKILYRVKITKKDFYMIKEKMIQYQEVIRDESN